MKRFAAALAACVISMSTTSAQAQGLDGLSFGVEYSSYDDGQGFRVDTAEAWASASFLLSDQVGIQVGLGHMSEVGSSDPFLDFLQLNAANLHLFYDVNAQTRLGGMLAWDSYNDGDWFYGIEATHVSGPLRLEGRVGRFDSSTEPAVLAELHGSFAVTERTRLRAFARDVIYDGDFGHYGLLSIGVSHDVSDSIRLYADAGFHENDFGAGDVYNGNVFAFGVVLTPGGTRNERMFTYTPFY